MACPLNKLLYHSLDSTPNVLVVVGDINWPAQTPTLNYSLVCCYKKVAVVHGKINIVFTSKKKKIRSSSVWLLEMDKIEKKNINSFQNKNLEKIFFNRV